MSADSAHPDGTAAPDRVGARYAATLGAQGVRLLASFVVAMIVPRTLGPALYGTYTFLLSTAATLRAFVDTGTQQAFFTFSSQERASGPLTRLYACALALQFLVVMGIVAVALITNRYEILWHGQQPDHIVWVTLVDWALFLALSLQQLGDSKGLTIYPQLIGAGVSLASLACLVLLWATGSLGFHSFVWLNLASAFVSSGILAWWLLGRHRALLWEGALAAGNYLKRWWRFARPLVLLQIYLPLVAYLGIWLVQRWYGAAEQGFYALALQWSTLALVFTNAGVSIFWREIAQQSAGDSPHLAARTYMVFSRMLFFISIVLACGLSAGSELLVHIVAGPAFAPAIAVVAIMAFYPASQTLGQLATAALKATEQTSRFARWSVALSIPDLLLVWLLLAPSTAAIPGWGLGAEGMAIRTAVYGLLSVHVLDWMNCRSMSLPYRDVILPRLLGALGAGALAFLTIRIGGAWLAGSGAGDIPALVLASLAYGLGILAMVWFAPKLAGLERDQLQRLLRRVKP